MTAGLVLAADPDVIERSADPGEFVVQACERAKAWLEEVLQRGEIEQIAEIKSQAEAVRVYTTQKQLGKDAQLAAAEIVRRAERGIGIAIRRGQAAGQITRRAGHGGNQHRRAETANSDFSKARPSDYASPDELTGNGAGIYHLADGVADEDFEHALGEAKSEGNMSRANVVRKIRQRRASPPVPGQTVPDPEDRSPEAITRRLELIGELAGPGWSSAQIGERLGIGADRVRQLARRHGIGIRADQVLGRARHFDSNRIARQTVHALEGMAMAVELADLAQIDPTEAAQWAASMTRSLRAISRFARQLKEVTSR